MLPFQGIPGGILQWVWPTRFRRAFELRLGPQVVATLAWDSLTSSAWGCHGGGVYRFELVGTLIPYVAVRRMPLEADLARLYLGPGSRGTLVFADGRRYDLLRWGFVTPWWAFRDAWWRGLFRFTLDPGLSRTVGRVYLDVPPAWAPDLPLLVLLGWYAVRLYTEAQAAAFAAFFVILFAAMAAVPLL